MNLDIGGIVNAGLQVVIDLRRGDPATDSTLNDKGACFVVKAIRSGKTIAEVSDDSSMVEAVSKLVCALIDLSVPKVAGVDDNLAKVFS